MTPENTFLTWLVDIGRKTTSADLTFWEHALVSRMAQG